MNPPLLNLMPKSEEVCMGSHEMYRKETKKPKKGAKKPSVNEIVAPPVIVEVVRKKRKEVEPES